MNISILLPYKENYASNNAGAVSLFVKDITNNSIYQRTTKIFGNTIHKNFLSANYINLTFDKKIFFSSNNQYVNSFINYKETLNSDLIEVHNRPNYIRLIKKKYQNRLFLYFHNDPLQMSGS
ncbi:glycosyl transferase family 1, partial [Candidatus Pelagibacter ubique]|nr:glycosyl transferase family 1 [Candidatus Pelagibacter ubique]